jgi:hypothetical protein
MYPEKHFKEDLQVTKAILAAAQDVANRWVLAWTNSGYRAARNVTIDFEKGFIRFTPYMPDGICLLDEHKISVEYIVDDSKLESNAKAWYEEDLRKRKEKSDYESMLKNDPKVKEYINLQSQYGSPVFGGGIFLR